MRCDRTNASKPFSLWVHWGLLTPPTPRAEGLFLTSLSGETRLTTCDQPRFAATGRDVPDLRQSLSADGLRGGGDRAAQGGLCGSARHEVVKSWKKGPPKKKGEEKRP